MLATSGRRAARHRNDGNGNSSQQPLPPAAQVQPTLVGLAVYSSDGEKLGHITQVGTAEGKPVGGFLDVAPSMVVIPVGMFEQKPDRIELVMTAAEVEGTRFPHSNNSNESSDTSRQLTLQTNRKESTMRLHTTIGRANAAPIRSPSAS